MPRVLVPVLLVAAIATPARADVPAKIARGGCSIDATNGSAKCIVQLDANPAGEWGQTTWSGYGSADLVCELSGSDHIAGGYGSESHPFPHGVDICTLSLQASDGYSDAYVS